MMEMLMDGLNIRSEWIVDGFGVRENFASPQPWIKYIKFKSRSYLISHRGWWLTVWNGIMTVFANDRYSNWWSLSLMTVIFMNFDYTRPKYLCIDRGKEYEGCLLPLLNKMGILSEKTPPYSSPSNGKAEWLNRTFNEHIRSMLFQANIPKSF